MFGWLWVGGKMINNKWTPEERKIARKIGEIRSHQHKLRQAYLDYDVKIGALQADLSKPYGYSPRVKNYVEVFI